MVSRAIPTETTGQYHYCNACGHRANGLFPVVEHGVTGLLVEPDNPSVLSDAMATILQNPTLADTLTTNGYELVKAHFNWKVAATKYERAFQALVAK